MKKLRLLLVALLAIMSVQNASAFAVGDKFQGRVVNNGTPNINVFDGVTYQITSVAAGNLTVTILETTKTGAVKFESLTADSTGTVFKVTNIYAAAFRNTNRAAITSLELPEGMTFLGYQTIASFPNLTTVKLPKSLEEIDGSFGGTPKLTTITIASGNTHLKVVNNVVYSAAGDILYYYPQALTATSFTIPSGVTTIKSLVFNSTPLTTISIPASCTTISSIWQASNTRLASITVDAANSKYRSVDGVLITKDGELHTVPPAKTGTFVGTGIKTVNTTAFLSSLLTRIELPDVETIRRRAIELTKVEEIVLGAALTTIEGHIAWNCTALKRFSFSAANPNFTVDDNGVLYSKDYTRLIQYPQGRDDESYTTHASTKIISEGAFNWARKLQRIWITNNVEEIGTPLVGNDNYQGLVTYSSTVNTILFNEPAKLKTIRNQSFRNTPLQSITMPASVETIGNQAFWDCTALNYVSVAANSNLQSIGSRCFQDCTALEAFQMLSPSTHKAATLTVGSQAFQNLDKLTFVSLGRNLSSLGTAAFGNCTGLEAIELFQGNVTTPAKLLHIGANVFQNCGLYEIQIPSSVKTIGNEAFNSCQRLETVRIPDATTSIGSQAFLFCGKLKEIIVEKGNPSYASSDGILLNRARTRLMQFPAGKAESDFYTMLPPTITEIADSAFYYNRNLKTVTIPRNVTSIGRYTFALCPNLEQVNLLGNATTADATAFHDMNQQTTLGSINLAVRSDDRMYYRSAAPWNQAKNASTLNNASSNDVSFTDAEGNEYFPLLASDDGAGNKTYDAMLLNVTESQAVTWRIPTTVKRNGIDYAVKLIGDEAFKNDEGVCEELILPDQVNYVGIKAFLKTVAGNTPLKNLFILNPALARENFATTRFETDETGDDYSEIPDNAHVYVKKSVFGSSAFTEAFKRYTQDAYTYNRSKLVRPGTPEMFDYKVPGIAIGKKKDGVTPLVYGTFCREFDVNLADYFDTNGTGKVYAFIAGDGKIKPGAGQGGTDGTEYHVIMRSINEGATDGTDGTYIPAYTGVLLKAVGGETPTKDAGAPEDFYYTIGEKDINAPVTGDDVRMRGVYEKNLVLTSTPGTYYVMQQGEFRKLPTTGSVTIPVHRAYLEVAAQAAGAKVMFLFNDNSVPTEIDAFGMDEGMGVKDESPVYDLQGRRVAAPTKGIYVRNGKKVIIK